MIHFRLLLISGQPFRLLKNFSLLKLTIIWMLTSHCFYEIPISWARQVAPKCVPGTRWEKPYTSPHTNKIHKQNKQKRNLLLSVRDHNWKWLTANSWGTILKRARFPESYPRLFSDHIGWSYYNTMLFCHHSQGVLSWTDIYVT